MILQLHFHILILDCQTSFTNSESFPSLTRILFPKTTSIKQDFEFNYLAHLNQLKVSDSKIIPQLYNLLKNFMKVLAQHSSLLAL